jgi:hypothetical protein
LYARRFRRPIARAALAAVAMLGSAPSPAQQNFGFDLPPIGSSAAPPHWDVRDDDPGSITLDSGEPQAGVASLRLARDEADGRLQVRQTLDVGTVNGNRLRLSGYVRSADVIDGYAGLWVRIEGAAGLLYFDRMGTDSGVTGTTDWTRYEIEAPLPPSAARVELGVSLSGRGTAWFDSLAISTFDTRTLPPPAPAAQRYLDYALETMQTSSINRTTIDWPALRADVYAQARGATTAADTYLAIRLALGELGDGHSYLVTPRQRARLDAAPVSNARTGSGALPPRGELLPGQIAYLAIPGFAGGTQASQAAFAEGLQTLIGQLDRAQRCGFIVDLRDNSGGNLWPMLAGIGPLLGDGEVGASVYPDGSQVPFWYRDGRAGFGDYVQLRVGREPYRLANLQTPIAVVVGPRTASSAEVLLTAFRGLGHARSFGSATRGLSAGNRTYPLGDGAALVMTVAATTDRNGRRYPGRIEPDDVVSRSARGTALPRQSEIVAASRWLAASGSCGATPSG